MKHNCETYRLCTAFVLVTRSQAFYIKAEHTHTHEDYEHRKMPMTKKNTTTNDNNNETPNKRDPTENYDNKKNSKNPSKFVTESQTKMRSRNSFDTNFGAFIYLFIFTNFVFIWIRLLRIPILSFHLALPLPMPFAIIR